MEQRLKSEPAYIPEDNGNLKLYLLNRLCSRGDRCAIRNSLLPAKKKLRAHLSFCSILSNVPGILSDHTAKMLHAGSRHCMIDFVGSECIRYIDLP